ncbi:MAG: CHAT domain-containing tetratricopeptide repeat protein [Acidobacteriota bacterium]
MPKTACFLVFILLLVSISLISCHELKSEYVLKKGEVIDRDIASGDTHHYYILLTSKDFASLRIDQLGVDVVVSLFDLDNKPLAQINRALDNDGSESIYLIADNTGKYKLEIRPFYKKSGNGKYKIVVTEIRKSAETDTYLINAQKNFSDGDKLRLDATEDSRRAAIKKYLDAVKLYKMLNDRSGAAISLLYTGVVHTDLGENEKAFEYLKEAVDVWEELGPNTEQAYTLNAIGQANWLLGNTEKALTYYEKALPIFRTRKHIAGEAEVLNNIGSIYWSLNEFQKALDYYNESLPLVRNVGDRTLEGDMIHNIGSCYEESGEYEKAKDYYTEALGISTEMNDVRGETVTLCMLGRVHNSLDKDKEALYFFEQALDRSKKSGMRAAEAASLNGLGKTYLKLGANEKSVDSYNNALTVNREVGSRVVESSTLMGLGIVSFSMNDYQSAMKHFKEVLSISHSVGDKTTEATALYWLAVIERHRGNQLASKVAIKGALNLVELVRTKLDSRMMRASYFASMDDFYQLYIDILVDEYKRNKNREKFELAFQVAEKLKARTLIESLAESRIEIHRGVDKKLLDQERALQRELNLAVQEHIDGSEKVSKKYIQKLESDLAKIERQIQKDSIVYASVKYPTPIKVKEVQQMLDKDTTLLEYTLGKERSFLWVINQKSASVFALPSRTEIDNAALQLHNYLAARSIRKPLEKEKERDTRIAIADADYSKIVSSLSKTILGPAASLIKGKRILIVPDGALHYIPFAVLINPDNNIQLVVHHEITMMPSASTLALIRGALSRRELPSKAIAIIADPVFNKNDERIDGKATVDGNELAASTTRDINDGERSAIELVLPRGNQSGRLIFTRTEAEAIKEFAGKDALVLTDFNANISAISGDRLRSYRIVHFATHGLLNNDHPDLSGLLLSMVNEKGERQLGFLSTKDVYNMELLADLVVLSACQTGLGKEIKGEGIVGLTRAFIYAGAPRVIVSLWNVNDRATAELMKHFYKKLLTENKSPTAALREAQIEMQETPQWNHPYFWAGFVLQGEYR